MRVMIPAVVAIMLSPSMAPAQKAVILVRHAERRGVADALTDAGRARAQALARVLKDAGVTAIVHSDTHRCRDTAGPLAGELKIAPRIAKVGKEHIESALKEIHGAGDDAVVLYVGHSDTVGPILQRFGYKGVVEFEADPYGQMFVLTPKPSGPVVIKLHFPKE